MFWNGASTLTRRGVWLLLVTLPLFGLIQGGTHCHSVTVTHWPFVAQTHTRTSSNNPTHFANQPISVPWAGSVGRVNCCWPSPTQSFSLRVPLDSWAYFTLSRFYDSTHNTVKVDSDAHQTSWMDVHKGPYRDVLASWRPYFWNEKSWYSVSFVIETNNCIFSEQVNESEWNYAALHCTTISIIWTMDCTAGIRFCSGTLRYFSSSRTQWWFSTLHGVNEAVASSSPHTLNYTQVLIFQL
jgi:hypothetical protein